ncbi:hypothetical protein Pan216_56260 [Planctomycetes bacterium Pan216]|uniref:Uncharacterized protein n=1 Tax=Kolteria novifilia TaxID=2527975 RepID=A0A518BCN1_9BACT|nr:hypothetical protein Pan216_56260 [Planctomycetes bacterium Pan216]
MGLVSSHWRVVRRYTESLKNRTPRVVSAFGIFESRPIVPFRVYIKRRRRLDARCREPPPDPTRSPKSPASRRGIRRRAHDRSCPLRFPKGNPPLRLGESLARSSVWRYCGYFCTLRRCRSARLPRKPRLADDRFPSQVGQSPLEAQDSASNWVRSSADEPSGPRSQADLLQYAHCPSRATDFGKGSC